MQTWSVTVNTYHQTETALTVLGVAVVVGDLVAALAATLPVDFTTRCTVTPSLIPTQT